MRLTELQADDSTSASDLGVIVQAYHAATERLRATHEQLTREVRGLREQLATANAALMRSKRLAALGEMAAGIAHEVRNPLASIRLYARMLEEDLSDRPAQREVSSRIADAVHGLDAVVGDVLAFARDLRPQVRRIAVLQTVQEAVASLAPTLEAAGVEVDCAIHPRVQVAHDPRMLRQALVNLVRNAVDAMPDGGRLTVECRRQSGCVCLTVRDTGPGIADGEIDRIFNPFFTTRPSGTGLGLAIVHRIVDAHGGTIAVHNDGGAVFTLTFPDTLAEQAA